jgi:hypothetical protein
MGSFSFLFSSEAPTDMNSDRGEKLRQDEWLISAILREINQLESVEEPAFRPGVETRNEEGFSP